MKGEKIYEYDLDITGVTDFGISLEAILSGKEAVPPQGRASTLLLRGTPAVAYQEK